VCNLGVRKAKVKESNTKRKGRRGSVFKDGHLQLSSKQRMARISGVSVWGQGESERNGLKDGSSGG